MGMTIDEALKVWLPVIQMGVETMPECKEALDMAIKALEQEPQSFKWCETCKEYDQEKHCCHRWSKVIRDTVAEMKQEPKTGHWIDTGSGQMCSRCGEVQYGYDSFRRFCASCGAKMVEPQESEDKE